MVDVQAVMRAMSKSAEMDTDKHEKLPRKTVITISRTMGSGGDEIAAQVAKKLGLKCYGHEILDTVAKQGKVNEKTMNALHERHTRTSNAWLYSVLFGKNVSHEDYVHYLGVTIRWLFHKGGVIVGRGGNIILAGREVLRVRITGSVDACAGRIAEQDGTDLSTAKKKVRDSNKARGEFIWKMFRKRANDPLNYDLTFNTDHFADYSQVTDMIIESLNAAGLNFSEKESDVKSP